MYWMEICRFYIYVDTFAIKYHYNVNYRWNFCTLTVYISKCDCGDVGFGDWLSFEPKLCSGLHNGGD